MKRILLIISTIILLPFTTLALDLGSKATPLKIEKWLQGEAASLEKPDGKTVYIVDFWATWCDNCESSIYSLNLISEKYASQNVKVLSVTSEKESIVKAFLKDHKLKYAVALDKLYATSKEYIPGNAAIPFAYIIDKDGTIAWRGSSNSDIESILRKVLNKDFNFEKEMQKQELIRKYMSEYRASWGQRQPSAAIMTLNKMIKLDPRNPRYYGLKAMTFAESGAAGKVKYVYEEWERNCQDDPNALAMLAAMMTDVQSLEARDPEKALKIARRAYKLGEGKYPSPIVTLARVYANLGLFEKAISILREGESTYPPAKKSFRRLIEYFTKSAEAQKNAFNENLKTKNIPIKENNKGETENKTTAGENK